MKTRLFTVVALLAGTAGAAGAQCASAPLAARQACFASVDLVNYMTPQLATAIAGGSSTLGQSGALGGLGHVAVSLRGTVVINGAFPNIGDQGFNTTGAAQSYTTEAKPVPGAGVDASIGLWKGVNLGATHVGGVDLLVSALYMPDIDEGDFSIKAKDGNLKLGYGIRIGALEETLVTPGVYVSYLQRDLPVVSLTGTSGTSTGAGTATGNYALNDFSVKTSAWRVVAAKSLLIFGLQVGIGQDTYKSTANIAANVPSVAGASATGTASMSMTRTNMFVGGMLNFFAFKLVVEAGQVSGGSLPAPFNTFDKAASESRTYVSGGLRIAF